MDTVHRLVKKSVRLGTLIAPGPKSAPEARGGDHQSADNPQRKNVKCVNFSSDESECDHNSAGEFMYSP